MQEVVPQELQHEGDTIREFFKRWPRFYRLIVYVFGPTLLIGLGPRAFLQRYAPEGTGKVVNIGSGPLRLRSDVVNYDITAYTEVDVVADIGHLPIEDGTVDTFVCDNVLEHVPDPRQAIRELHRILKPGGVGYISTPFLYPFHASPHDYQRWTASGLTVLCKDFSEVRVGVRSGLFSALNTWLCYVLPSLFSLGSERLYWLLVNLSLFLFFPVKFLDLLANRLPFARHTAAVFSCVVIK